MTRTSSTEELAAPLGSVATATWSLSEAPPT
jgi:hypothetical protein